MKRLVICHWAIYWATEVTCQLLNGSFTYAEAWLAGCCSVGAVIFYALAMSVVMVGVHAVFHVPDDLFLDEPAVGAGEQVGF